jgi:hypothetical protein
LGVERQGVVRSGCEWAERVRRRPETKVERQGPTAGLTWCADGAADPANEMAAAADLRSGTLRKLCRWAAGGGGS